MSKQRNNIGKTSYSIPSVLFHSNYLYMCLCVTPFCRQSVWKASVAIAKVCYCSFTSLHGTTAWKTLNCQVCQKLDGTALLVSIHSGGTGRHIGDNEKLTACRPTHNMNGGEKELSYYRLKTTLSDHYKLQLSTLSWATHLWKRTRLKNASI